VSARRFGGKASSFSMGEGQHAGVAVRCNRTCMPYAPGKLAIDVFLPQSNPERFGVPEIQAGSE
jgi:hypothetical protein